MARVEIDVDDVTTALDQKWETKKEKKKNDKHKEKQGKSVRPSK